MIKKTDIDVKNCYLYEAVNFTSLTLTDKKRLNLKRFTYVSVIKANNNTFYLHLIKPCYRRNITKCQSPCPCAGWLWQAAGVRHIIAVLRRRDLAAKTVE